MKNQIRTIDVPGGTIRQGYTHGTVYVLRIHRDIAATNVVSSNLHANSTKVRTTASSEWKTHQYYIRTCDLGNLQHRMTPSMTRPDGC